MHIILTLCKTKAGELLELRSLRPAWTKKMKPYLYPKKQSQKTNQLWCCMSVVPTTWKAETGGSLEPRRAKLACITIT